MASGPVGVTARRGRLGGPDTPGESSRSTVLHTRVAKANAARRALAGYPSLSLAAQNPVRRSGRDPAAGTEVRCPREMLLEAVARSIPPSGTTLRK